PQWFCYRPPPPPPPPPPPDEPPPPEPELLPGGLDADEIVELKLDPTALLMSPRSETEPWPWYQLIPAAAAAAAAAPAATVNFFVQASSTSSATAYGRSSSYRLASSTGGSPGPFTSASSSRSATLRYMRSPSISSSSARPSFVGARTRLAKTMITTSIRASTIAITRTPKPPDSQSASAAVSAVMSTAGIRLRRLRLK